MKIQAKGITLIALIITVIILLILAGTAISIAINGGDLFSKASQAREEWNSSVENENATIQNALGYLESLIPSETPELTITIELDGVEETLTRNNFKEHIGKVATKYVGAPTSFKIMENLGAQKISNQYRLYWIDFENKYKDGVGTIYLKADYTSDCSPNLINTNGSISTSNIKNLNPLLYANGDENAPAVDNANMQAVIWLTDTSKWENLKNGINTNIASKIKYVVGGPSLEMLIDSYNAVYPTDVFDTGTRNYSTTTVTKLDCKYPFKNSNNTIYGGTAYGYAVGPSNDSEAINGYYFKTSANTILKDTMKNGLYYYYTAYDYWLASPSAESESSLLSVACMYGGGYLMSRTTNDSCGYCPVVALSPDVDL